MYESWVCSPSIVDCWYSLITPSDYNNNNNDDDDDDDDDDDNNDEYTNMTSASLYLSVFYASSRRIQGC